MYYHYANSAVLSRNSQWSMFVYYQCIIMYYYFRSLTIDRELQEIGANQAELVPFAHILREWCKIHINCWPIYIMFQRPAPAENPQEFQWITQIPCNSPTQSTNHAKFAHFVNIFYFYFRHLHRQRTLRNSSELRRFCTICPHSLRITQNSHHLRTLYITFQMPDQW